MDPIDPTVMQKETIVKDDGRRLIYYRFVPPAQVPLASEHGTPEAGAHSPAHGSPRVADSEER